MTFVHFRLVATLGAVSLVGLTACGGGGTDTTAAELSALSSAPAVASANPSVSAPSGTSE